MKIILRNQYLSRPCYNRYLNATANDSDRAKRLYNANIRLAQAFHPLITQFEVVMRNSLNLKLTAFFGDPDWIINQKNGFMHHPSLRQSHFFLRTNVQKAESTLMRKQIPVTSGKIISDQTFGFWLAFFLGHHYTLVRGQPIHIFPYKPTHEDRASIYAKLDQIRAFRNRVNHCEPLCFNNHHVDCSNALHIRNTLYDLIAWINPELVPFFQKVDNVPNKINQLMAI